MPKPKTTKLTPKKSAKAVKPTARTIDKAWHARFLEVMGNTCNVTLSAKAANISRFTAYDHYKTDKDFAAQWDDAKEAAVEVLEAEAWARARKQSDTLIIFLLKAHKPGMYREKIDHRIDGELEHSVIYVPAKAASREEWEQEQKAQNE